MTPWVKICGITLLEDALAVADAGADAIGFIFYKGSMRYVSPDTAGRIVAQLPPTVTPFGVFVNETKEAIASVIEVAGLRGIQLSGDEQPVECAGYDIEVVKAVRINEPERAASVEQFPVQTILLDGAGRDTYGGSGKRANNEVALRIKRHRRLILSGGISPENVIDAVTNVQPYGIDVNSGIELSPGRKDHHRLRSIFHQLSLREA